MANYQKFAPQLRDLIKRSPRILLTITRGPDGDSIGSLLAMCQAVRQFGRECYLYSPEDIPPMYHYLLNHRPIMRDLERSVHDYQLIILFDAGDVKRVPLVDELIARNPQRTIVVNIDHHPTVVYHRGKSAVDFNFVDTDAAATTEMLFYLFQEAGVPLSPSMATSLLTGILTDTGHFANLNTTSAVIEVAAKLMAKGADHRTITEQTMRNKSLGQLRLWGRALARLGYNPASGVVSTVITLRDLRECDVDAEATTGIANFLNGLSDGKVSLILQEEPDGYVKGSFRTTSNVDVATLASQFGGGGHPRAAGFRIRGQLIHDGFGWHVAKWPEKK